MFSSALRDNRVLRRVMATYTNLSTNGSGYIGVASLASTAGVTSATDWASTSALYIEYRVAAIELFVIPTLNTVSSLTTPAPSYLVFCQHSSGLAPSTFGDVACGTGSKVMDARKIMHLSMDFKGFNDAQNWTNTSTTIPSDSVYGWIGADSGTVPASVVSTAYFRILVRYLVEFRTLG